MACSLHTHFLLYYKKLTAGIEWQSYLHWEGFQGLACRILYSGKLSREKTFANFEILGLSVKVFSAKIDGHTHTLVVAPNDPPKFSQRISYFHQFAKVFSLESFPLYSINVPLSRSTIQREATRKLGTHLSQFVPQQTQANKYCFKCISYWAIGLTKGLLIRLLHVGTTPGHNSWQPLERIDVQMYIVCTWHCKLVG